MDMNAATTVGTIDWTTRTGGTSRRLSADVWSPTWPACTSGTLSAGSGSSFD
jgi:hypothetical protein